ncbi:MAG: IS481 family transposase [Candidatus Marinimicrobia bacterium]|nr:IS481 family transposase [Candidatus Neomarinimicrobiota bacterium]
MTATEQKIVNNRLTLLQLAEKLRNVSQACRYHNVSRSQFYEYKRAFQEHGLEGLKDRQQIPKTFPIETPNDVKDKMIQLSIQHPAWGQVRISDHLRLQGISISPGTVRNIWIKENMETRYKRILRLEEEKNGKDIELTEEQIRLIETANPCFKERKVESPYPGYLLSQDTFMVGTIKGIGRIYLQAVIDTYGSYAFGKLYTSKLPETAADIVYDKVLPFYESHNLKVEHILTDNGREYCGRPLIHPYQIYLELNDIKHRRTKVATPRTNGFVERFNRTILDEFFREVFRNQLFTSVEELQIELDKWLDYYNNERTHRGYRNMGKRPVETIIEGKKKVKEKLKKKDK